MANDMEGILEKVYLVFEKDAKEKKFDWLDQANRAMAVLVNCSLEPSAQSKLIEKGIVKVLEKLLVSA